MLVCNDFVKLMSNLSDISLVVGDESPEKQNVIIRTREGIVEMVGISTYITHKIFCASDVLYNDSKEDIIFQVSIKDLMQDLGTYKSLITTKVERITFGLNDRNKVVITVYEVDNNANEMTNLLGKSSTDSDEHASTWLLENIVIKPNMVQLMDIERPTTTSYINASELMRFVNAANPLIGGATGVFSKLYFAEDYVFVSSQNYICYMQNTLNKDVFCDVALENKLVHFLSKSLKTGNEIGLNVAKFGKYLYFGNEFFETYLSYNTNMADHKMFLDSLTKRENGFEFNRWYLRDILRRFTITPDNVQVLFDRDNTLLTFKNSRCEQNIPLSCVNGFNEMAKLQFQMMPDVFSKVILFDEDAKACGIDSVRLYVVDFRSSKMIIFSDDTNNWASVIKVIVKTVQ